MDEEWLDEIYKHGDGQPTFERPGIGYRARREPYSFDDQSSVVSELTECTSASDDTNARLNEIKVKLNTDLCKLGLAELKDKCRDAGISGFSTLKKTELVQLLELEFSKMQRFLNSKSKNDLKHLCKSCDVKNHQSTKKAHIVCQLLSYLASNLIFKVTLDEPALIVTATTATPTVTATAKTEPVVVPITPTPPRTLSEKLEELEKQRKELEFLVQEEIKRQEQEQEEAKRVTLQEEETKKRNAEKERKAAAAKKKQSIPKNVRTIIWNHYIGEDIIKHKCVCCKKVTITNTGFEVGHVLSEANGGTHEINNLRPICFSCNHSMGTENMIDFVVKYGLYIG